MNIDALRGKTITECYKTSDDEIIFVCDDGSKYKQYHCQDCCESVAVEDISGELSDLLGTPVLDAFEKSSSAGGMRSGTWTFYTIVTMKHAVTIRWFGSSNGYYSESVDFIEVTPVKPEIPCERCKIKAQEVVLKFDTAEWNICEDCKEIAFAVFNAYMYPKKN